MTHSLNTWISVKIKKWLKIRQIVFISTWKEMDRYLWFDAKENDIVYVLNKTPISSWKALIRLPKNIIIRLPDGQEYWYTGKP